MLSALILLSFLWGHIQKLPDQITQTVHSAGQTTLAYMAGFKSHEVIVDGCSTRYLEKGRGPTLLLLHGIGVSKETWLMMTWHLQGQYHLIIPDLPGHGQSCRSLERDYDVASLDKWLLEFFKTLSLGQTHIVANSMGATVSGWFAWQHPQLVSSLTLIAPAGIEPSAELTPFMKELIETGENRLLIHEASDAGRVFDLITCEPLWLPPGFQRFLAWDMLRNRSQLEKITGDLLKTREALKRGDPDIHTVLESIPVPVQIIWGEHDRVMHISGADTIQQARPDFTVHRLAETGHVPMVECPDKTARLIETFIQGLFSTEQAEKEQDLPIGVTDEPDT